MADSPIVTVLTPTYNRSACLPDAIRSVLGQQLQDWEMLVINDGGADVRDIVEGFGDERLRYWSRPENTGKAACLNFGLARARGRYIAYLDDDDLWYPNHLSTLVAALEAHPEVGVAYSDLYRTVFVRDARGRRHPLEKRIEVCRDYNRMFMFHFNHTLHVSLMHRRELALRAGGYDERVRVLIDWDLTRKLSFYADFFHLPVVTGEYYEPVADSDRISDVQRRDGERYRMNMRRIRADLPPEPWPMVEKVAVILPVPRWDERTRQVVTYFADFLDYPCRIVLVNTDGSAGPAECLAALGPLGELGHVRLVHAPGVEPERAYAVGAGAVEADWCYLASRGLSTEVEMRLICALDYMAVRGCRAVRWEADGPATGLAGVMLPAAELLGGERAAAACAADAPAVPADWLPEDMKADFLLSGAARCQADGDYESARALLERALEVRQGGVGGAYVAQRFMELAFALGDLAAAERMCRELIEQGYGADNWVRLGQLCQARGACGEAADAYRRGLAAVGLRVEELDGEALRLAGEECAAFKALAGLGECLAEEGRSEEAARALRRAVRLCCDSPRPLLAFGRMFLSQGEPGRAKEAFGMALARARGRSDVAAAHAGLARAHAAAGEALEACRHWLSALEADPANEEALRGAAALAPQLGLEGVLVGVYERFLAHRPGHLEALDGLAELCVRLGREGRARELSEQAALLRAAAQAR